MVSRNIVEHVYVAYFYLLEYAYVFILLLPSKNRISNLG